MLQTHCTLLRLMQGLGQHSFHRFRSKLLGVSLTFKTCVLPLQHGQLVIWLQKWFDSNRGNHLTGSWCPIKSLLPRNGFPLWHPLWQAPRSMHNSWSGFAAKLLWVWWSPTPRFACLASWVGRFQYIASLLSPQCPLHIMLRALPKSTIYGDIRRYI